MNHKGTVPLETDRLTLRRFTAEDTAQMFQNWANDSDVTKYLRWQPHGAVEVTKRVVSDWIAAYTRLNFYHWAMEIKTSHTLIGCISVVEQPDDRVQKVHIGYCTGKAWWRQGYTSEALIRLIKFFFEDVGMNRIEARHDPRNPNSGKVMRKVGLQYEGTLRESDWSEQGICDAMYYAILAKDYFHKEETMRGEITPGS